MLAVNTRRPLAFLLFAGLLLPACSDLGGPSPDPALQAVRAADVQRQIETLASDDFEGRSVGTPGGDKTVEYLIGEFKRIGLAPGNPDGSYVQAVPLTGHTSTPQAVIEAGGQRLAWSAPDDYVAVSYQRDANVRLAGSEMVFVGYGVKAPEYDWDDYKGVDLRGKTLVVLVNDPQIPDPADPSRLDDRMFKGKAMTYYGRWTYKFETGAALGAAAVLIVHDTATAGYPYAVVRNSWGGDNFDIHRDGGNPDFPPVAGWISGARARELFSAAGLDLDHLKQAALRRDFHPLPMRATLDITVANRWRDLASYNVVGRIPGSDPRLAPQTVIYSAHWDHFGWDQRLPGSKHEQIYHGALDNASGVAALLQIATAFKALPRAPRRSILFIATTAEERGLLGAQYYANKPLYPLRDTLADINIDGLNLWGRTHDLEQIGLGASSLDADLAAAAQSQGRHIVADQNTEKGYFYRADHFEFAKAGVPSLYTSAGEDYIGRPADYGKKKRAEYTDGHYHKVTDVVQPDWDYTGAVDDIRLLFQAGYRVAQAEAFPHWYPGAEFRARRDAMLQAPR